MTTLNAVPTNVAAHLAEHLPTLEGWCSLEKATRLIELAVAVQVPSGTLHQPLLVDLGVFGGRSLFALGLGALCRQSGRVIGVDPYTVTHSIEGTSDPANSDWWAGIDHLAIYRNAHLRLCEILDPTWWSILRMDSTEALEYFAPASIAILHQDTNHSPEVSVREVAAWSPKVAPGGIWVMDDADWPSMQPARAAMATAGWAVAEDHTGWVVWRREVDRVVV